jgi:hypothetical protein
MKPHGATDLDDRWQDDMEGQASSLTSAGIELDASLLGFLSTAVQYRLRITAWLYFTFKY